MATTLGNPVPIADALAIAERCKDELHLIDELIQIYEKVEEVARANPEIQQSNCLFYAFSITQADSMFIRLRRLVEGDKRTASVVRLGKHIAENYKAFTPEWYLDQYKGTGVESFASSIWVKYATGNGESVCPMKVGSKVDGLKKLVLPVERACPKRPKNPIWPGLPAKSPARRR